MLRLLIWLLRLCNAVVNYTGIYFYQGKIFLGISLKQTTFPALIYLFFL
jgi:hypothetical protein